MASNEATAELTHIDNWIDDDRNPAYARLWFRLFRRPAIDKVSEANRIITEDEFPLFTSYLGQRYRVTGCSRLGDVWLSSDYERRVGYELRVDVAACAGWTEKP